MGVRVDNEYNILYDKETGARLVYHGVNVVYKLSPYYPDYKGEFDPLTSFNEQDVENLHKWGFNVVRLYIAWEGTEPQDGQFDIQYIQNIKNIVKMCKKKNIAVFLDMHQDLFSSYFCGEGLPNWATESVMSKSTLEQFPEPFDFNINRDKQGFPLIEDCHERPFFMYYLTENVNNISQDFMTNVGDLADKFARFWKFIAENFKDNDNILGYEFLNEPWGGSFYKNSLEELLPRNNNDNFLLPFYTKLNDAIREVDEETLVFFEPIVLDFINQGFSTNVGGEEYRDREVYSYHIYCPLVNGTGAPISQIGCNIFDKYTSKGNEKNYKDIGLAGFLTEFGALDNSEDSAKEVRRITGDAGALFNSWTYWQYKYYNDITTAAQNPDAEGFYFSNGELQLTKVKALSQPYGISYCGIPIKSNFNALTKKFTYEVQVQQSICDQQKHSANIMFINLDLWYPNGYKVEWQNCDDQKCSLDFTEYDTNNKYGYLSMSSNQKMEDGTVYGVSITPNK
ncbi:Glycoside hydrolase, superfamily [Pseudocohnilembus persalinus]|uniref:Glycoside hydrolase, superfamily n=1 Tax=Pseudocohnilembus persalinus TaxID=266149 RepID=A0A0V0R0I4_PSEPJ|nr:Glycoside hydrolase, superfamily [Pseudocohnilembus persalinus]|eukprot:KRX07824.1 Glycoside hydrolase, superfamily [Pseudocohnilembus persalinus]